MVSSIVSDCGSEISTFMSCPLVEIHDGDLNKDN